MAASSTNYSKKSPSSIALLSYCLVVPFSNNHSKLSSMVRISGRTEEEVCDTLRWVIEGACAVLQGSMIENKVVLDDGVVEAHTVICETHLVIYLKAPATVSVQKAFQFIRKDSFRLMQKTILSVYSTGHKNPLATHYLAMCGALDVFPVSEMEPTVYNKYLKIFVDENNLDMHSRGLTYERREQLNSPSGFMSLDITVYE